MDHESSIVFGCRECNSDMRSMRCVSYSLSLAVVLLTGISSSVSANAVASEEGVEIRRFLMEPVKSWGYQLQRLDVVAPS